MAGGRSSQRFSHRPGYGVSSEHARTAITRIEEMGCNLDCMQEELENLAFVM